jgi:uncharacterized protein YcaQ
VQRSVNGLPGRLAGDLSLAQARRIALAAQGFSDPAPSSQPDRRHLRRVLGRIGLLQIDSVNVLVRSHYLPLFSRLGRYAPALLDTVAYAKRGRELFEYWGHEASLIPVDYQPLLRWRMARAERGEGIWQGIYRIALERPDYVQAVLAEVAARGPIGAGELSDTGRKGGASWWNRSPGKMALEYLFWSGRVTTAKRRGFERLYDLPERALPASVLAAPTPPPADAQRELIRIAAKAHGVGTEKDLRDYFRLSPDEAKPRVAELVEAGELLPVAVQGWEQPAFLHREARLPRRIRAQALLSPFDSLVWERARTERLFGFRYRIGIYTPADKREHGYYVLPFLLGDRLVARVDLKADRGDKVLRMQSGHAEPGVDLPAVAEALSDELSSMAAWLGLERVWVKAEGTLAAEITAHAVRTMMKGRTQEQ